MFNLNKKGGLQMANLPSLIELVTDLVDFAGTRGFCFSIFVA